MAQQVDAPPRSQGACGISSRAQSGCRNIRIRLCCKPPRIIRLPLSIVLAANSRKVQALARELEKIDREQRQIEKEEGCDEHACHYLERHSGKGLMGRYRGTRRRVLRDRCAGPG